MRPGKSVMLLGPWFLALGSCASLQVAPVRLPEAKLPACFQEQAPTGGEAVGAYEFAPAWVWMLRAYIAQGKADQALQEALGCASETARALREAVTGIRMNNRSP